MNHASLDTLATRLAAHLESTKGTWPADRSCGLWSRRVSLSHPFILPGGRQMSQEDLAAHLARVPDTEFDTQGHIVGWGITLVPTWHHFVLSERALFTWCAFDTILFPPLLHIEAQVQSECAASGQPITFRAGKDGHP